MICSLCGRKELKAKEFVCSTCYPKFKFIILHYAKGIKHLKKKRNGKDVFQLTLEFEV